MSAMRRRATRGPGTPPPRARVPPLPLLLLALAARGGCAAPAPRAEDLSLGVVSARPGCGAPAGRGDPIGAPRCLRELGRPAPISWAGRLRLGHRLSVLRARTRVWERGGGSLPGSVRSEPAAVAGARGGWGLTWPQPRSRLRAAPKGPLRRVGQQSQPPRAGRSRVRSQWEWRGGGVRAHNREKDRAAECGRRGKSVVSSLLR